MDYSKMVSLIEKLCQDKGISKTTAYVQSGVGKDFGANIKKGNIPSAEKVKALADYLNCSTDYLLGRKAAPETAAPFQTQKEQQLLAAYKAHPELQFAVDKLLGIDGEDTETIKIVARSKDGDPVITEKVPKSKVKAAVEDKSIQSDEDL